MANHLNPGDKVLRKRGKPRLKSGIIVAINGGRARVKWGGLSRLNGGSHIHSTIKLSSLTPFDKEKLHQRRKQVLQTVARDRAQTHKNTVAHCANGCHRWLTPINIKDGKCTSCGAVPVPFVLSEWNICLCKFRLFKSDEPCPNCDLTINLAEAAND